MKSDKMTTYFVLGGYGQMGRIASRDLAETAKGKIIVAGRDEQKTKNYARRLGKNVIGVAADASKSEELVAILKKHRVNVVVNCATYYSNLDVMNACLEAGCHYLDLGGLFHMTKKQLKLHSQFRKRGLLAVLGCGSTPGITNILAGYGAGMMNRLDSIHVRFAGYSWTHAKTHFVVPYSMYTVFDEFESRPAVLKDGRMTFVRPMSGKSTEYFPDPIGKVVTFYTLHSELATFQSSFRKKGIKNCDFKVSFDESFVHDVQTLIDAGMSSRKHVNVNGCRIRPVDMTVKEMNKVIPDNAKIRDIEYVRVTVTGKQKGKNTEIVLDCLSHSSQKWHASAGDIDTGCPPSIIAQFIANKKIKKRGVLPPELCVPSGLFFKEIAKRGMEIFITLKKKEY